MAVLKARIGGAWVPISGASSANPNNALGEVVRIPPVSGGTVIVTTAGNDLTTSVPFTMQIGRRYRLVASIRAVTSGNASMFLRWMDGGTNIRPGDLSDPSGEWYLPPFGTAPGQGYGSTTANWVVDGDGVTRNWKLQGVALAVVGTNITVYHGEGARYYIEDIGPNSSPALPIPDTPPAWIAPTFQNGWQNYHADFLPARYRKIGDIVYLRGLISTGTINTPAFTVPVGFRPPFTVSTSAIHLPIISNGQPGYIHVRGNGEVNMTSGSNQWFDLAPISWSVTL